MKSKSRIPSSGCERVAAQVRPNTPAAVVEAIAAQLERVAESQERIAREGTVVRDMKGSVIAHPSLQIELTAQKAVVEWLAAWGKR